MLFVGERTKIYLGENKTANMNFEVDLPPDILTMYLVYLKKEDFTLSDYHINNKTKLELFNKTHTTTFDIKKRQEITMLITFNKGAEKLDVK